jgi:hypothetical protein
MISSMLTSYPGLVLVVIGILLFASGYWLRASISQRRRRRAAAVSHFTPEIRWMETARTATAASIAKAGAAQVSVWQISQVGLNDNIDPRDRVGFVGGIAKDGSAWKIPTAIVIQGIESGKWKFYVSQGTRTAWVVVATTGEHKYLKTEGDGLEPDSLLKLPHC